jgi:hypothetical protein
MTHEQTSLMASISAFQYGQNDFIDNRASSGRAIALPAKGFLPTRARVFPDMRIGFSPTFATGTIGEDAGDQTLPSQPRAEA